MITMLMSVRRRAAKATRITNFLSSRSLSNRLSLKDTSTSAHWLDDIPNSVKIVEVGPRDGLQNEKQQVDTQTKKVLIEMLADAGLKVVEATSFVNPKAVPQMADAYELFTSISKRDAVSYPVLVPNVKGLEQVYA